jgi:hypothetical protein
VTRPEEFNVIHKVTGQYERTSVAILNPAKSKALAIGGWTLPVRQLDIAFHLSLKTLGIIFAAKTEISGTYSWRNIVHAVRAQAIRTYTRKLCLAQRVQYVNTFILEKLWYTAQILPQYPRCVQQLATICNCFIWQGAIFRVPADTLHQPKQRVAGYLSTLRPNVEHYYDIGCGY